MKPVGSPVSPLYHLRNREVLPSTSTASEVAGRVARGVKRKKGEVGVVEGSDNMPVVIECTKILFDPSIWIGRGKKDITLVFDDFQVIQAHREVLRKCSYFKSMLSTAGEWREKSIDIPICLRGVDSETAAHVVRYLYTSEIALTEENLATVAILAEMWGIDTLTEKCRDQIRYHYHLKQCLLLWKWGIASLDKEIFDFVVVNADSLHQSEEYLSLSLEQVFRLVDSDELNIQSEYEVYKLLIRWLTANCPECLTIGEFLRGQYVEGKPLIETIRFENIHFLTLMEEVDKQVGFSREKLELYREAYKSRENIKDRLWGTYPDIYHKKYPRKGYNQEISYPLHLDVGLSSSWKDDWVFWKIQISEENLRRGDKLESTSREYQPPQDDFESCEYYLTCKYSEADGGRLLFAIESDELLHRCNRRGGWVGEATCDIKTEFRLINQFDCRHQIRRNDSCKVEDGVPNHYVDSNEYEFALGVSVIPFEELFDPSKGWVVDGILILSAKLNVEEDWWS